MAPGASYEPSLVTTRLALPGNGRDFSGIDSHVLLPITTGCPMVISLNRRWSSGISQIRPLLLPITRFLEWAATMLMCGNIIPSIMSQYEIEIKSLLGGPERATKLKEKIKEKGGSLVRSNNQLNHYFILNGVDKFKEKFNSHLSGEDKVKFNKILEEGNNFSVRTRDTDGKVLLVIKASIGEDSSANGVSRMEFESEIGMSLDDLDRLLLDAGLEYQAKWSRAREEYQLGDVHICLDKNAGYGYLAEFEKIVTDRALADGVKQELLGLMGDFGVEELPQDRMERMFAHYNENWHDYYGTDKIFN